MRFWWVNQNQTFQQEVRGGYLWSPKRKANGDRNAFYDSMREVVPGDLIFSFADTFIKAIGMAQSYCYECPKPLEFGSAGMYWDRVGWRVDVRFQIERQPIQPRDHMEVLAPLLPTRYAPLRANGDGLQSVYLTELSAPFALALANLMGQHVVALAQGNIVQEPLADQLSATPPPAGLWERELVKRIEDDQTIPETEKASLVLARRGQGLFKHRVQLLEHECRITKVDRIEHLRASHCKPWRDSNNVERLDAENGLLLTPTIDHLFDRGFISFEGSGRLLISPVAHNESLRRMGVTIDQQVNVGTFSEGQRRYLEFHREQVFLSRQIHD
jgi:putative restriction endonuclease